MIRSASSFPTTSARVNPNTRSAAGLNSRTRPVVSIVMMQSSAESRKVRLRASSVVAGLPILFRWSCSDGIWGHGFKGGAGGRARRLHIAPFGEIGSASHWQTDQAESNDGDDNKSVATRHGGKFQDRIS